MQDLGGNGVAGKTVTFAVVTGGGSLSPASGVSDASGNVSTVWTLGATVGAQSISATSAGLAGSPLTISATGNAVGGGATQLAFTVSPANTVAGVSVSPAIVVQARTAAGALAASFTGNVTLAIGTNPGGATPGGTLTVAAVAGVATFSNISLDKVGVGYTLVASAAGLTGATSATFNISPAAASALAFTVQPATAAQTIAISPAIQVTARDAFGNTATGFAGAVTLGFATNPTGASLGGTLTASAVAGVATFSSVNVNLVGAGYALSATSIGLASATSATFSITAFSGVEAWNNPAGGSWSLATNWSLGRVPLPTDSIVISLSGTYTVTLDTTFTTSRYIILGGGTGTQTLALASRTLTLNGPMVVIAGGAFNATGSTVAGASAISNSGTVTLDGSTVSTTLANLGVVVASGSSTLTSAGYASGAGSTLRIGQINGSSGSANLTVTGGSFTNNGTIELTNLFTVGYGAQLSLPTGTLTNAAGSTISILGGTTPGGARTISAALNNLGTLNVAQPLSLPAANAAHTNGGTINVTGGSVTLNQSGTGSFTNTGTVAVASGFAFGVNGGAFTYTSGSITGPGSLNLANLTLALNTNLSNASLIVTLFGVTVNGTGTLTNATSQALTLNNTTLNAVNLVNQGLLVASGNSAINGAFTTVAGSTLQVGQVDGCCGQATLTVANSFTNNGTIEITNLFTVGYGSQLTMSTATLTNAAGGTISILGGTTPGGARTLAVDLNNQGTINVAQPLSLGRASDAIVNSGTINVTGGNVTLAQTGTNPTFTNSGTISIASGYSFAVSGGTFTYSGGTITGPGGFSFSGMTFALASSYSTASAPVTISNSTITGPGSFTNAAGNTLTMSGVTVSAPMTNQGTLVSSGASALNGALTTAAGSILRVGQVDGSTSNANLTVANGFTNNGAIELTVIFGAGYSSQLTVASGTLTNAAGATITSLGGTVPGGTRTITAAINNLGTITAGAGAPLTINGTSATHTNAGTIDASAAGITVTQSGTTPSFTQNGTITVGTGFTFGVSGGSFNVNVGATTGGAGNLALTNLTGGNINGPLAFGGATVSSSTIGIGVAISTSGGNWTIQSNSNVGGTGSLTNAAGKTLTLIGSTVGIPVTNQGTLVSSGASALNGALTTVAGSTIQVGQIDGSTSNANLTVANGFTNNGAIELTVIFGAGYSSQLTVASGTLTNAAGATITSLGGTVPGGARTITAAINNLGTITAGAGAPLTINGTSATHTNAGTIDASAANITVTQGGTSPSLTTSGTITVGSGFTFAVANGSFNQAAGPISGAGTLDLSGVTASLSALATPSTMTLTNSTAALSGVLSTATTALIMKNSTINGTGSVTNAVGQTLTMYGSTINTPLSNNGLLFASGASNIGGAFTTAPGSTLRIGQLDGSTSLANLTVANAFTNNGTIELTELFAAAYSSQLTVSGALTNAAGGTISALAGTAPGGARTISTPLVDNLGTINVLPGSAGTLTVTGSLTLDSTSVVNLEIGGTTAGTQFDQLVVQQYSTLGGTLNVALINAFAPTSGQNFKLIPSTFSTTPGFATVNLPATMTAVYNSNDFTVHQP